MKDKVYPITVSLDKLYATFLLSESNSLSSIGATYNSLKAATANVGYKNWCILRIQPSIKYLYIWDSDCWRTLNNFEISAILNAGKAGKSENSNKIKKSPKKIKPKINVNKVTRRL